MGLRILRIIIAGILPFIGFSTVLAQSEQGKTLDNPVKLGNPVKKEHLGLNETGTVLFPPLSMMKRSGYAFPSAQPAKAAKDSIALIREQNTVAKDLNPMLQGYAAQEADYNQLNGVSFHRQGMFPLSDVMSVYGGSMMDEHPDLLTTRSAYMGLYGEFGNWDITASVEANRYMTEWPTGLPNHVTNQYGIAGSLTYHFNPEWSATMFGAYYSRDPYFNMASFPYVKSSRYGGYLRYDNRKVGMKMGMERNYDSFRRTWQNEPIVTPVWHVTKGFDVELPFGHLVGQGLRHMFGHDHRHL